MEPTGRSITLSEALAHHAIGRRWLEAQGLDYRDWYPDVQMTEYANGHGDFSYLGEDQETVFEVHGQAEPILVADAQYWQMRQTALVAT